MNLDMVEIAAFFDELGMFVAGAPNPLLTDHLRLAAIEYCKRTLCSNWELDPVDLEAGVSQYELEPPSSCLTIWRVMWVETPERLLTDAARPRMASLLRKWNGSTARRPIGWLNLTNSAIQLVPAPTEDVAEWFTPHCAFIPSPKTEMLDRRLWIYHREALIAGACAKIMRIPRKPWTDPAEAARQEVMFQTEISKATANTRKGESVSDLRVDPVRF